MIKTEIPSGLLPQAVRSAVKQSYSDWVIQDADTIGRANMGTVYKVEIEKMTRIRIYTIPYTGT